MKRFLLTFIIAAATFVGLAAATSYQKLYSVQLYSSLVDGTPIGSSVQSTGAFSILSASGAYGPPHPNTTQMGYGQVSFGNGESDFFNQHGTGAGGFNWYAISGTNITTAGSPIMQLSSGGSLTATTFNGNINLPSTPTQCSNGQAASGISTNGSAVCINAGASQGLIITSGICTTPVAAFGTCSFTATWPTPFVDSNYSVTCANGGTISFGGGATAGMLTVGTTGISAGSFSINLTNGDASAAGSTTTSQINCTAVHL